MFHRLGRHADALREHIRPIPGLWPYADDQGQYGEKLNNLTAEREDLWPQTVGIFPLYEDYARKTDRQIPVVLLTPQG